MAVCTATLDAVEADGCSFWRRRFLDFFDSPAWVPTGKRFNDNAKFRDAYKQRQGVLHVIDVKSQKLGVKPQLQFGLGIRGNEKNALAVLKDLIKGEAPHNYLQTMRQCANMITEAHNKNKTTKAGINYESKNIAHLIKFVGKTNLIQIVGCDSNRFAAQTATPLPAHVGLLYTIQCLLAPALLSFDDWHVDHHYGFPYAQSMVYANNVTTPIIFGPSGLDVNMQWLLRNIQYWRCHLIHEGEVLRPAFEALKELDRPHWWVSELSQGTQPLGGKWKGSYAFVDREEIDMIRGGLHHEEAILDQLNGEEDPDHAFQELNLNASDESQRSWPPVFESHLQSLTMPASRARTRAQRSSNADSESNPINFATQSLRFQGGGQDSSENFFADGWLNPLPPQHGIPGWQRITMMKYFVENGNIDMDALWAYEGIMLPGGRLMVGRWWCPSDGYGQRMYSGPFILWNVDKDEEFGVAPPAEPVEKAGGDA